MSSIKYTTDGKKVIVVGKLNNTETIVQEIFVTENKCEIPAGENFVVKSLLDEPSKSWKEAKAEQIEAKYNDALQKYENATKELDKKTCDMTRYTSNKMNWMKSIADNINKEWFDFVYGFVNQEFTHFVSLDWYSLEIIDFDRLMKYDHVEIKAFGIALRWDKNQNKCYKPCFSTNYYSDGSGSNTDVKCFRNLQDAKDYIFNEINTGNRNLSDKIIEGCKKYEIEIPQLLLTDFYNKQNQSKFKNISDLENQILKLKQSIKEVND